MTVGLPFSGKSTAAKEYEEKGYYIISRDKIMEELIKHPDFIKMKEEALAKFNPPLPKEIEWIFVNDLITEQLAFNVAAFATTTDKNVFYDGTNLKSETRSLLLNNLKESFEMEALVFPATQEEIFARAKKSHEEKTRTGFHAEAVNEGDLKKMITWYQPPTLQEGFTQITEYHPPNELTREFKIPMK